MPLLLLLLSSSSLLLKFLSDSNGIRTHNHLVRKQTFSHFTSFSYHIDFFKYGPVYRWLFSILRISLILSSRFHYGCLIFLVKKVFDITLTISIYSWRSNVSWIHWIRSRPPEVFLGKGVLKICNKFTPIENTHAEVRFQ